MNRRKPVGSKAKLYIFALLVLFSTSLLAQNSPNIGVCLSPDGYVVPCTPGMPGPVASHWATNYASAAGVPVDVYILGGDAVQGFSEFQIQVDGVFACSTGTNEGTTPVRHCVVTVATPGSHQMTAVKIGNGNFEIPMPTTLYITN